MADRLPQKEVVELVATDGTVLGRAVVDRSATPDPHALVQRIGGTAGLLADLVVERLGGHRLVIDDADLADALVARGVTLVRAARLMVRPLPASGPMASGPGVEVGPLREAAEEYATLMQRAYPPSHPDHEPAEVDPAGAVATIVGYLSGTVVGPPIRAASAEARIDGRLVGVGIVSVMPADEAFEGGPWVTDLFVDPAAQGRGVGRALLAHALARLGEAGQLRLGLAVTIGNPAVHLYRSLGFDDRGARWTLLTPT